MASFERPRGTRDFGPEEMARRRALKERMRAVFERYGYQAVRTPTFEHLELFTAKSGEEIVEQLYAFEDKSERELTLRPELTAPVIRFFNNELRARPRPIRVYYFGNCFRYERPQSGRYREFWQFGCELIGAGGPAGDAEVIAIAHDCVQAAGVPQLDLRVGHIGLTQLLVERLPSDEEAKAKTYRLIDKDDEELVGHLQDAGAGKPLVEAIDTVAGFVEPVELAEGPEAARAALDERLDPVREALDALELDEDEREAAKRTLVELADTLSQLASLGVDEALADLGVARGLDYYTGVVFEIEVPELGAEKQVAGGGSYTLAETLGGQPTATTGFGLGFDRVLLVSDVEAEGAPARVHVTPIGEEARRPASELATELREAGVATTVDLRERSISKNLDLADRLSIPKVILLGSDEIEAGEVTVKDMASGEQRSVAREPIEELVDELKG